MVVARGPVRTAAWSGIGQPARERGYNGPGFRSISPGGPHLRLAAVPDIFGPEKDRDSFALVPAARALAAGDRGGPPPGSGGKDHHAPFDRSRTLRRIPGPAALDASFDRSGVVRHPGIFPSEILSDRRGLVAGQRELRHIEPAPQLRAGPCRPWRAGARTSGK